MSYRLRAFILKHARYIKVKFLWYYTKQTNHILCKVRSYAYVLENNLSMLSLPA